MSQRTYRFSRSKALICVQHERRSPNWKLLKMTDHWSAKLHSPCQGRSSETSRWASLAHGPQWCTCTRWRFLEAQWSTSNETRMCSKSISQLLTLICSQTVSCNFLVTRLQHEKMNISVQKDTITHKIPKSGIIWNLIMSNLVQNMSKQSTKPWYPLGAHQI